MIIDTSALIAILRKEPEAEEFIAMLAATVRPKISVVSYVEAGIVTDAERNPTASRSLDEFIRTARIELLPVTVEQARLAREAYRDFGRGSGHRARLNFGDCFAYALAKETGERLLFKGNDFSETDVPSAV